MATSHSDGSRFAGGVAFVGRVFEQVPNRKKHSSGDERAFTEHVAYSSDVGKVSFRAPF